jgi:nickel superoxide dismutase
MLKTNLKTRNMKKLSLLLLSISILSANSFKAHAHCEIPCGIYQDSIRIQLIAEHITTIEKSMNQINELSKSGDNHNQLVRWVMNKEEHANKIQHIVSQYFLHQRIKITDPSDTEKYQKYIKELSLLHQLLVYSMKAKQTTDLVYIDKLKETLHLFAHSYLGDHGHKH